MKKQGLMVIGMFMAGSLIAQVKWDGEAGDGNWATPANWTEDRVPGPEDQVLLDNSLQVSAYTVSMAAGNTGVTVRSLTITPLPGLQINLLIPSNNISSVALQATGQGDAIVLNQGAVLKNSSGAISGTPLSVSSTGFFRINNGGRYIHNTERGHTNGLVSRLSAEPGTEDGVFEFDVPSAGAYTVSVSNRVYGHLIFSAAAAGGVKTYTGSGTSPCTVNGDLEIQGQALFSYGANTNKIVIKKNCKIFPSGVLNISNGSNAGMVILHGNLDNQGTITESGSAVESTLAFEGSSAQNVSCTGLLVNNISLLVNNAGGITLHSRLSIAFRLRLQQGKVRTSMTNMIELKEMAVCSGGSASSFIEGPMKKFGDGDFLFPLGKGGIYSPIGISGPGDNGDAFTAEYHRSNPQTYSGLGNLCAAPVHHVSYVEYWTVERNAGNAPKTLNLFVSEYSFVKDPASLLLGRFDNGRWQSEGNAGFISSGVVPPYVTGSFYSQQPLEAFGAFTLASSSDETVNPLPVSLLNFNVAKNSPDGVELRWQLTEAPSALTRFELEEAGTDRLFHSICLMDAASNTVDYQYNDNRKRIGLRMYRLKIWEADKLIAISPYRQLVFPELRSFQLSMQSAGEPHVVAISIDGQDQAPLDLLLLDGAGNLKRLVHVQSAGAATHRIAMQGLPPGVYIVTGAQGAKRSNSIKFFYNGR